MPSQPKQPAWLKQKGYLSNVPTDQLVERLAVRPNSHTRQNKSHTPADRRLGGPQTASEYLSTIDQDASTAAFDVLAEALVSPKILRHKCAPTPAMRPALHFGARDARYQRRLSSDRAHTQGQGGPAARRVLPRRRHADLRPGRPVRRRHRQGGSPPPLHALSSRVHSPATVTVRAGDLQPLRSTAAGAARHRQPELRAVLLPSGAARHGAALPPSPP